MSTPEPSVSFLCSAYRTERTVVETIESVLAQTRTDWELVVVDNGPSDDMAAIVEPFTAADPRIALLRQVNSFAWGGVNAAGRMARGRYVAVLHSDDLVMPTFVERLVPILDADPSTAALAPDAYFLTDAGVRRETFRKPVPERYRRGEPVTYRELIDGWVPYYTALVRRDVWDDIGGFRNDVPTVEDLGLWLDLLDRGLVLRCLEEPLTAYRENENSDSRGARGIEVMEESWEKVVTASVSMHGSDDDRAALTQALVRSRHRRATVRARRLLLEGDFDGARSAAESARAERPDRRTRVMAWALAHAPRALRAAYRGRKSAERTARRLLPRRSVQQVSAEAVEPVPRG